MKQKERPFRYKVYGEGPPLVIVPGLDGITEFFADIIPQLTPQYRVILYYLPLLAEAPSPEAYTFDFIAADMKEVLDELGTARVDIIGESFGGAVAQVFALNYPEAVDRLVLVSTFARTELSLKLRILAPIARFSPQWVFARAHVHDVCEPSDPRWAKDLLIREAAWADHASVMARIKIVNELDLRSRIPTITAPALLVIGGIDRFTGPLGREMLKLLPDARLEEIPGAGHLCHMVYPDRFVELALDFLGENREGAA